MFGKRSGVFRFLIFLGILLATVANAKEAGFESANQAPMMKGLAGWQVTPLFTIGEQLPSTDPRYKASGSYQPVGRLDGIGALQLSGRRVRVYINHELAASEGYPYLLRNGMHLTGSRISFVDIDRYLQKIVDSGIAYHTVVDRRFREVIEPVQINEASFSSPPRIDGFDWFCSSQLVEKGMFGFADTIYFTNEEASDPDSHPYGGSLWALNVTEKILHAVPAAGRNSWENTAAVEIRDPYVALLIAGDATPQTLDTGEVIASPLWLYIGRKNASAREIRAALPSTVDPPADDFLNRNGLLVGQLFYFVPDTGVTTVAGFHGMGQVMSGTWREIEVLDESMAGMPGFDALGYKNGITLRREAKTGGAFQFSRPEDVSTAPAVGTRAVFASTGQGFVFKSDDWGAIYQVDLDLERLRARIEVLYDGDDPGRHDFGIRSPDNLDWADDGFIYVQEDAATQVAVFGENSGEEASIWRLNPRDNQAVRIARMDRSVVVPIGTRDLNRETIGAWESSGVLDVTGLFPTRTGARLLIADVQAHGVEDGPITADKLVESGQLLLLRKEGP